MQQAGQEEGLIFHEDKDDENKVKEDEEDCDIAVHAQNQIEEAIASIVDAHRATAFHMQNPNEKRNANENAKTKTKMNDAFELCAIDVIIAQDFNAQVQSTHGDTTFPRKPLPSSINMDNKDNNCNNDDDNDEIIHRSNHGNFDVDISSEQF